MTISLLESTEAKTRLGVGLDPRRRSANPDAWKHALGNNNRVSARLELLPDEKTRWNVLGLSAVSQIVFFLFLLSLPLFFPERLHYAFHYDVMPLSTPLTEVPVASPPPEIKPKAQPVKPKPKPEVVPQPEPPKVVKIPTPKFEQPIVVKPKKVEVKAPEINKAFEEAKIQTNSNLPKRPKEDVKVGNLSTGNAAPATVNLPLNKVQTGGFGDENGLPGPGDPNKRANANARGSPLLPGGPGYGNGTGGATGIRGTVASTGFGNGIAVPPPAAKRSGAVQSTGFSDATVAAEAPKKTAAPAESATIPVSILDKPRPQYSAEGRKLRIEGDVTLDVVFLASGEVVVNRVVSGLGHGLDEAAARAAQQIKFKPAKRDGQPVDFPARVRIEFRLAY